MKQQKNSLPKSQRYEKTGRLQNRIAPGGGGWTDASSPAAPKIRMPDPEPQPAVPVPGIRKEEGLCRPSSGIGERIAYFPRPIFSMRARVSGLWPRKRT